MDIFYGALIAIVLILWFDRIWSYYHFRKSGDLLFVSSFRNWRLAILPISIGVLYIPSIYLQMKRDGSSWFEQLLFWVLISSLGAIGYVQRAKINQGGILQNGSFWSWRKISSWNWDEKDSSTLVLNVRPKIRLSKTLHTMKIRTKVEQKDSIEQLLREFSPGWIT